MNVTMTTTKELVMDVLKVRLVPFLQSSPGVGKSSLAREIAKENRLEMIDLRLSQMDPADLNGLPFLIQDKNGTDENGKKKTVQKAGYVPMNIFPLEDKAVPDGMNGWLILLDEFNSAPMAVQAAAYKVVLDRQVGMHKLHPNVFMMAAGNLMTDKAIVNRISTAMQSRLIHFTIATDKNAWIKWADAHDIDHRVKSFIHFKPNGLHMFDPQHNEETFPCPRTWEFVSRLIKPYPKLPHTKVPLLAGTIGEGMAREFYAFTKIFGEIPNYEAIRRDPENVSFGNEPSIHYALSGLISHHLSEKNVDQLIKFLVRLNIDHQVICLRSAIARNAEIKKTPAIRNWISTNAKELMD